MLATRNADRNDALATDTLITLCTCPDEAVAERLATALVEARLAACVNILPGVRSVYRWQDGVQQDREALLLIKSPAAGWDALAAAIRAQHPYELPELIAVPVDRGLTPYLDWIRDATS